MLKKLSLLIVCTFALSACSEARYAAHVVKQIPLKQDQASKSKGSFKVGSSYIIKGKRYYPTESYTLTEKGTASWYGPGFHGKQTANGEIFDKHELTAAHRTLQLPSIIKVTNLDNGRQVILRVNDRGPFAHDRILDVSERAASLLGFKNKGVAKIKLEVMADASKELASIAKSGRSTKGMEIAYNQNRALLNKASSPTSAPQEITPTQVAYIEEAAPINQAPPSSVFANNAPQTTSNNARLPSVQAQELDQIVQNAVRPNADLTSEDIQNQLSTGKKMFVQAGSFSQENNALNYSQKLASLGSSKVYMTRINDQSFFRVRLGPYQDPSQAQSIINTLNSSGNSNAVMVIE